LSIFGIALAIASIPIATALALWFWVFGHALLFGKRHE
jgi:hypothetical protein